MKLYVYTLGCILICSLLFFSSCKKDFDRISTSQWNPEVALPFIQADFDLTDLVGDSNLSVGPDSSYVYVHRLDSMIVVSADSIFQFPESINGDRHFSLGEIEFDDIEITDAHTINDFLPYLDKDAADSLAASDGIRAVFPTLELLMPFQAAFEEAEEYVALTFSEGHLQMNIENMMPVPLSNIHVVIVDIENNNSLATVEIPFLDVDQSYVHTISLSGISLSNSFRCDVLSLGSPGSEPDSVSISLQDGIRFTLTATDLKAVSGAAKITQTQRITDTCLVVLDMPSDEQLNHATFAACQVKTSMQSDLNADAGVEVRIQGAQLHGEIPLRQFQLTAGAPIHDVWELEDVGIDFTTEENHPFNRLAICYTMILEASDEILVFDSSMAIHASVELTNAVLAKADGYLGQQSMNTGTGSVPLNIDFLESLGGELRFENPSIEFVYRNGFGIPMTIHPDITGINSQNMNQQELLAGPVQLNHPETPGNYASGSFVLDKSNSAIVDLMAIQPDQIVYEAAGYTNEGGQTFNFVDRDASLVVDANIHIPLVLQSGAMHFLDTVEVAGFNSELKFEQGQMIAKVTNSFPFDLTLTLRIPDALTGEILETLEFTMIGSATVGTNGKVSEPHMGTSTATISETFFNNLDRASHALLEVDAMTWQNGSVPVALCSDYRLSFAIGYQLVVKP